MGVGDDYFQIRRKISFKFSHSERLVILRMDEVHIRSVASNK